MPSIDVILPHWLYWGTLIVFPLIAMVMARRSVKGRNYKLSIGYMILITGGILGLHRLYMRNLWGLLYLPLVLAILWGNAEGRSAREAESRAENIVNSAQRVISRLAPKVDNVDARLAELRAALAAAEEGTFAEISARKKLEKAQSSLEENAERLETARADLQEAAPTLEAAAAARTFWSRFSFWCFAAIGAAVAIDALMLPILVRRANARLRRERDAMTPAMVEVAEQEQEKLADDSSHIGTGITGAIDRLSYLSGEFVSYWMVIAVFAYYYEVVARYVFNSPTIWVHEGMFLMFGMQYLIAGAYAALTDAHVKVDVFYAAWSPLRKAVVDLLTSVFFFIFAGTLLVTGWIFAMDATRVGEVSFSEWTIAYWPFKWAIAVGAVLLILQGIAKLLRDAAQVRNALTGV